MSRLEVMESGDSLEICFFTSVDSWICFFRGCFKRTMLFFFYQFFRGPKTQGFLSMENTSGDSQFQEFFVKLQHLVLSLLASNQKHHDARSQFFHFVLLVHRNVKKILRAENLTTLGSKILISCLFLGSFKVWMAQTIPFQHDTSWTQVLIVFEVALNKQRLGDPKHKHPATGPITHWAWAIALTLL